MSGPTQPRLGKKDRQRADRALAVLTAILGNSPTRPVTAEPDAAAWGALVAVAAAGSDSSMVARVYVFDSYWEARAVEDRLAADAAGQLQGQASVSGVNGPLLLWATADAADNAAVNLLGNLRSAFAGDE
ncbi:MAG: hypothetical protein ABI382_05700 [Nakamurella sp.]